jgi:hypothetical protein
MVISLLRQLRLTLVVSARSRFRAATLAGSGLVRLDSSGLLKVPHTCGEWSVSPSQRAALSTCSMGQCLPSSPVGHRHGVPTVRASTGFECAGWLCLWVPCPDSSLRWGQSTLVVLVIVSQGYVGKALSNTYVTAQRSWGNGGLVDHPS